ADGRRPGAVPRALRRRRERRRGNRRGLRRGGGPRPRRLQRGDAQPMKPNLFLAALLAASPARAEDRPPADGKDIQETRLADGVYQFTVGRDAYVRYLNSVAVICDRDVLVFDTDTRPSSARLVLAAIRKITPKPVRFVVNSHWHPDHWSGNDVYLQ